MALLLAAKGMGVASTESPLPLKYIIFRSFAGGIVKMSDFFAMEDIRSRGAWQAAVAELIATFSFVFLGAGAVVVAVNILGEAGPTGPTGSGLLLIALAHGLAIALLVASIARISGGHINPAVTVSMVATRKIGLAKGAMYVVGQLMGAALGAYLLMAVIPDASEGTLGAHALAGDVDAGTGLVIEALLTFFLVFVILPRLWTPGGCLTWRLLPSD